jgi:hypothetical protein
MDTDAPATTPVEATATTEAPVVFRGKKRKFFRQRPAEEATTTEAAEPEEKTERENPTSNEAPNGDEEGLSVAEIIRQRNARKHRLKGVGFGADDASATAANADDELSLMIREEEQKAIDLSNGGVNRRFTAQTGVSSELVNKHMYVPSLLLKCHCHTAADGARMEFIESEIAKRKSTATPDHGNSTLPAPSSEAVTATTDKQPEPPKHVPLQSKLQEIDLGDEVRSRNEAMTELARRRLQGEVVEEEQSGRPKKVRLGRDGKPWRPRNRRNSDDIKRDQLVEEIMRESRRKFCSTRCDLNRWLTFPQSTYTRHPRLPRWPLPVQTKMVLQMIALLKNSRESSWRQWRRGNKRGGPLPPRRRIRRIVKMCLKVQNWVAVATQERP